jgi:predicted RNA polymerase sigma factor
VNTDRAGPPQILRGRLLAMPVRQFGDLDLAEDAASEAIEAALERWPVDRVSATPVAWLLATARRTAVDRLRRDRSYAARLAIMQVEARQHGAAASGPGAGDAGERSPASGCGCFHLLPPRRCRSRHRPR